MRQLKSNILQQTTKCSDSHTYRLESDSTSNSDAETHGDECVDDDLDDEGIDIPDTVTCSNLVELDELDDNLSI